MTWPALTFDTLYSEPSRNGVYKSKEHHGAGVKIVNMGELFAYDVIADQEMNRLQMNEMEIRKSGLLDGDLLFGRRSLVESGSGKCSLVEGLSEPTTFESSIIRVRLDQSRANPRFFFYWFKSHHGKGVIRAIVTGTNVKGITGNNLKKIVVVYPPLKTQNSLVSKIRTYDDLIENNRRRIQLLEQAARLLYREWFVHLRFPGHEHAKIKDGVPEGWKKTLLHEIAEITMGQSPQSKYYNEDGTGLPFHQGVTNFGVRFPTNQMYCTFEGRMAEPGDILFSVRAPVGRINLNLDKIIIGRGLAAIRSNRKHQNFLFYQLKNHFFKEDMMGGGAIFAAITKKDLHNVELIQPPSPLIGMFMEHVFPIDRQIETLNRACGNLTSARDILLPRLMNGEIAV